MTGEFLQPNIEDETFKEAQQLAEKAQETVKEKFGLTLSNIEFVELRRIASQVLTELKNNPNTTENEGLSDFNPEYETATRFIKESYGVIKDDFLAGTDSLQTTNAVRGIDYDKREEQMKEYLRRKQDEMYKL